MKDRGVKAAAQSLASLLSVGGNDRHIIVGAVYSLIKSTMVHRWSSGFLTLSYASIIRCLKPLDRGTAMISGVKESSSKTICLCPSFLLDNASSIFWIRWLEINNSRLAKFKQLIEVGRIGCDQNSHQWLRCLVDSLPKHHHFLHLSFQIYHRKWNMQMHDFRGLLVCDCFLNNRGCNHLNHLGQLLTYILWWNSWWIMGWTSHFLCLTLQKSYHGSQLGLQDDKLTLHYILRLLQQQSWSWVTDSNSILFSTKRISLIVRLLDRALMFNGFSQIASMKNIEMTFGLP